MSHTLNIPFLSFYLSSLLVSECPLEGAVFSQSVSLFIYCPTTGVPWSDLMTRQILEPSSSLPEQTHCHFGHLVSFVFLSSLYTNRAIKYLNLTSPPADYLCWFLKVPRAKPPFGNRLAIKSVSVSGLFNQSSVFPPSCWVTAEELRIKPILSSFFFLSSEASLRDQTIQFEVYEININMNISHLCIEIFFHSESWMK